MAFLGLDCHGRDRSRFQPAERLINSRSALSVARHLQMLGLPPVLADIAIRLFPWGNELHLGTLAALIGAPMFVAIALRLGNVRHG